jgi:hypothetical protein
MSDMGEVFQAMRAERQAQGQTNRDRAAEGFQAARALAKEHGLALVQYGDAHYALIRYVSGKAMWRHHIHPGNQRICMDRQMPTRAPFLKVPCDWTLVDVVQAAIKEMSE